MVRDIRISSWWEVEHLERALIFIQLRFPPSTLPAYSGPSQRPRPLRSSTSSISVVYLHPTSTPYLLHLLPKPLC
jgi:hypothetical protein